MNPMIMQKLNIYMHYLKVTDVNQLMKEWPSGLRRCAYLQYLLEVCAGSKILMKFDFLSPFFPNFEFLNANCLF